MRFIQKWLNPDLNPNPDLDLPTIDGDNMFCRLPVVARRPKHYNITVQTKLKNAHLDLTKVKGPTDRKC